MNSNGGLSNRFLLPLPAFVLHPLTALFLGAVHIYFATGHLSKLFEGSIHWTDIWKGFGALAGAYVFAALATRGFAQHRKSETAGNAMVSETAKFTTNPANS